MTTLKSRTPPEKKMNAKAEVVDRAELFNAKKPVVAVQ
jgi:hypothetical protein